MKTDSYEQIRKQLKLLLFFFAKESDQPGNDLQEVLREVISELHGEVKEATQPPRLLKLVRSRGSSVAQ